MNQEKFGQFIKQIRKNNNLTQKQLADKYHVTYQAVSKWENGKNMPDTSLIKQMSKDFNISLEEMFDGELKTKRTTIKKELIITLIIILSIIATLILISYKSNFTFKTLSSSCPDFSISGNIAYNDQKSSIYITNIEYCGETNNTLYKDFECVLYESHNDIDKKISSSSYEGTKSLTLEEYLETVTITVDNYKKTCKNYSEDSLYLSVIVTDEDNKNITYKIPLSLKESCSD